MTPLEAFKLFLLIWKAIQEEQAESKAERLEDGVQETKGKKSDAEKMAAIRKVRDAFRDS